MNQRIRELVEQCHHRYSEHHIDLEKFAEMIVQECGQWFNDRLVVEPDYNLPHRIERNRAVVGVMKEYNTHFGVEE
jgi:hypothetical protein